jgi:hypothetical protein
MPTIQQYEHSQYIVLLQYVLMHGIDPLCRLLIGQNDVARALPLT